MEYFLVRYNSRVVIYVRKMFNKIGHGSKNSDLFQSKYVLLYSEIKHNDLMLNIAWHVLTNQSTLFQTSVKSNYLLYSETVLWECQITRRLDGLLLYSFKENVTIFSFEKKLFMFLKHV